MLRPFQISLIVALTATYCIAPLPAMAVENEQITFEQIQARVAKWRDSFVNVRVVYELRSLPPLNEPLLEWSSPPDPESVPRFAQEEWIWADHGLDLLDSRAFYWTPGKVGFRDIDVFNGPKKIAFRASYQKSREEVEGLKELRLQGMVAGKPTSIKSRAAMHGLYWPNTVQWLPDILAKGEWKVEGVEPIFGDRCAKIAASNSILWLDLEHDCLPRRYQLTPNSIRKIGQDFVVDELQQLEGGLWFPKRARLQLQTDPAQNQLIVVTEAAINQSLDLTRFDPPTPITGTVVTDLRTGTVHMHGEQTTPLNQASKPKTPTNATAPPSAVPPAFWGRGWLIAMVCISIALLTIGLWFRRKELRG